MSGERGKRRDALREWWRWPLVRSVWGLYWEMRGYYRAAWRYSRKSRRAALLDTLLHGWRDR